MAGRLGHGETEAAERDRYERKALESLGRAIAAGYNDVTNIRTDTDLDTIRGHDDFEKLLAKLAAASADGHK
jgi:hypothetical protein